jgi:hypothetical protein
VPGQDADEPKEFIPVENGHPGKFAGRKFTSKFQHLPVDFRTMVGLVRIEGAGQRSVTVSHHFKADDDLIFFPARLKIRRQDQMKFNPLPIRRLIGHTGA